MTTPMQMSDRRLLQGALATIITLGVGISSVLTLVVMKALSEANELRRKQLVQLQQSVPDHAYTEARKSDEETRARALQFPREADMQRMRAMIPRQTGPILNQKSMPPSMEDIVRRNDAASQERARISPREVRFVKFNAFAPCSSIVVASRAVATCCSLAWACVGPSSAAAGQLTLLDGPCSTTRAERLGTESTDYAADAQGRYTGLL